MSSAILNSPIKNKTWLLAFLLTLVALTYGLFEVWAEHDELSDTAKIELAQQSLDHVKQEFRSFEEAFVAQSQQFSHRITDEINRGNVPANLVRILESEYAFWGFSVFKDQKLWLWSDFAPANFESPDSIVYDSIQVTVERSNNVTFLNYRLSLISQDGDAPYHIITRKKVKQENILPIGDNAETSPSKLFQDQASYPVHFSFFDTPPDNAQLQEKLTVHNQVDAGFLYTLEQDYSTYIAKEQQQFFVYRAVFYVVMITLFTLFLISISRELSIWYSLFLKLVAITIAWLFFANIEYGIGWVELFGIFDEAVLAQLQPILGYAVHAIFILLITLVCVNPLLHGEVKVEDQPLPILESLQLLFGILSGFLILFFLIETYALFIQTSIPILDLEIFPSWQSWLFYITSGSFAISVLVFLILLGSFLLKFAHYSTFISFLYMSAGFLLSVLLFQFFGVFPTQSTWVIFTASIFFVIVLFFVVFTNIHSTRFIYASRLRMLLLFSYIAVCFSYIAIYKGYSERLNEQMQDAAQLFIDEEETQAEQIAQDLLNRMSEALSGLTATDLQERPAYVENYFTQQTQQLISPAWERFSISTQLVTVTGETISEYSSDLDSPAWTKAFNMNSLVIPFETEQIRVENLRPVIRERPLYEATSNYSSFRRAWIPLYEPDSENRIAWILCSVYRERPQFEKPLRSVIAAEDSRDWNAPISITEYINGKAARQNIVGTPLELPGYLNLPEPLVQKVDQDSTLFRTSNFAGQQIREYFVMHDDNQIVRTATSAPGLENHLFSLIRFFFCLLTAGLFVLGPLSWKQDLNLLGHNHRFRDRLIDRFILASLICLMALIITTYYAINNQTQKSIQDQLLNKLDNLAEAITLQESQSLDDSQIPLNELTSTLDADAALYKQNQLLISTTSQIYNQHLLPSLLPWDIYNSIYERGNRQVTRKVTLGTQELLIGYQPWLDENSQISGVIAIPTFIDAPKFNQQLLSTTSYLLGFYVIIFGVFILVAALISTQITSPLEALREGLKKITKGDLETTLPVKSKDEIGALTNAYNVMVYRLKDLQDDLAQAEREAAWKEMAQQVAHEIKNPLTPMKLNLQHLERQLNVSEEEFQKMKPKIEQIASNMIGQIESLNQIASDFSKFAKPIEQEFSAVEINSLLESIANLYGPEKQLKISVDIYNEKLWVRGVKDELRRVLINLVKNAQEAMPDGGTIALSSTIDDNTQQIIITVADSGTGISEENREQIFVPNFSTKSSGTGLGLAITKKIIEAHNGTIHFITEVNEGTTFTIQLPLYRKSKS